jgi:hypothetical protein
VTEARVVMVKKRFWDWEWEREVNGESVVLLVLSGGRAEWVRVRGCC